MHKQDNIKKYFDIFNLNVSEYDNVLDSNSSEVYILTLENREKVVLKIPFNSQKLQRERKALEILKGKVAVPDVIKFYNGEALTKGALLLSYINGEPLKGNITNELAYQMGEVLAKIHNVSLKKYGEITIEGKLDEPDVYFDSLKEMYNNNLMFCQKVMDIGKVNKCNEIFEYYLNKLPMTKEPCLIHSDFRLGNILVNDGKVVGIIDFEVANGGVPDSDFILLKNEIFDKYDGVRASFINGYKVIRSINDLDNTLLFYEFLTAFSRIGWCIKRKKTAESFYFEFNNQLDRIISLMLQPILSPCKQKNNGCFFVGS